MHIPPLILPFLLATPSICLVLPRISASEHSTRPHSPQAADAVKSDVSTTLLPRYTRHRTHINGLSLVPAQKTLLSSSSSASNSEQLSAAHSDYHNDDDGVDDESVLGYIESQLSDFMVKHHESAHPDSHLDTSTDEQSDQLQHSHIQNTSGGLWHSLKRTIPLSRQSLVGEQLIERNAKHHKHLNGLQKNEDDEKGILEKAARDILDGVRGAVVMREKKDKRDLWWQRVVRARKGSIWARVTGALGWRDAVDAWWVED